MFLSFPLQDSLRPSAWLHFPVARNRVLFSAVGGESLWLSVFSYLLSPVPPLFAEFFIDGLGSLLVGSCPGVIVDHQKRTPPRDPKLAALETSYSRYRANTNSQVQFKLALHYFKNHLYCST